MARSNSYSYTMNRDQLITAAYQITNIYGLNDTISAIDLAQANTLLNLMIKSWEANSVQLWKRTQGYLFPALNTASYSIGPTGTAKCTESYVSTTISSDEALGQTALSVTSTSGMTVGDHIGIELDDGTRQWTTITNVNSSVLVTVNNALTAQASSGNTVIAYTTGLQRPLRIIRANNLDISTSNQTESRIQMISYDQYFNMPVKTNNGTPYNAFYDKQLDNGILYLYNRPNNVNKIIVFTYHKSIMDMTTATDNFDMPQEWNETILYNLASKLLDVKNIPGRDGIRNTAAMLLEQLRNFDSDMEPFKISLRRRRR